MCGFYASKEGSKPAVKFVNGLLIFGAVSFAVNFLFFPALLSIKGLLLKTSRLILASRLRAEANAGQEKHEVRGRLAVQWLTRRLALTLAVVFVFLAFLPEAINQPKKQKGNRREEVGRDGQVE